MIDIDWQPSSHGESYARWDLPAHTWTGSTPSDDTISITFDHGEWSGVTEADQCVRRDLDDDEIVSVIEEFTLVMPAGVTPPIKTEAAFRR